LKSTVSLSETWWYTSDGHFVWHIELSTWRYLH